MEAMFAEGRTNEEIAAATGLTSLGVLRMVNRLKSKSKQVEVEAEKSDPQAEDMDENKAKLFLSEIGITGPAAALRNDVLKPSNPLKGNPKALRIAEALLGPPPMPKQQPPALYIEPEATVSDPATLISQIQMNVENFGPLLGSITKPDEETFLQSLYSKSEHELAMLLRVVEKTRLVGNMTNQLKHMFWMGTSFLEMGTQLVGLKTQGFSQALKTQEIEVGMILKEIALEQADALTVHQRPEMRLAFLVSTTLLSVDTMNRRAQQQQQQQQPQQQQSRATVSSAPPPQTDVKETYKDL